MKVWELEEGKEYIDKNSYSVFMFINRHLNIKTEYGYSLSQLNINTVLDIDFTEYTPPTDWSKVEVDTKVLVSVDGDRWIRRYFARYDRKYNRCYAWDEGATSWTSNKMSTWTYVKLYTEE